MKPLKLPHRLVLLDHIKPDSSPLMGEEYLNPLVTPAVIAETYMMEKIAFDGDILTIIQSSKTGHSLIDDVITLAEEREENYSLVAFAHLTAFRNKPYRHVLDNLVENQILKIRNRKVWGVSLSKTIVPVHKQVEAVVSDYIQKVGQKQNLSLRDYLTLYIMQQTRLKENMSGNIETVFLTETTDNKSGFNLFKQAVEEIASTRQKAVSA